MELIGRSPNQNCPVTEVCLTPSEGTVKSRWPVPHAVRDSEYESDQRELPRLQKRPLPKPLLPLGAVEVATHSYKSLENGTWGMSRGGPSTLARWPVAIGPGQGQGLFSVPRGSVMFACPSITLAAVSRAVCGTFVPEC